MAGSPSGFSFALFGDTVVISHHGRHATTLRGAAARDFVAASAGNGHDAQLQELMARLTGNYRRGNERTAGEHPRNRRR